MKKYREGREEKEPMGRGMEGKEKGGSGRGERNFHCIALHFTFCLVLFCCMYIRLFKS